MFARLLVIGALAVSLALPSVARADEGGGTREELQARIKKKMEEIRRLMEENEKALLELSTGKKREPRRVDVEVPEAPAGSTQGGTGTSATGEDIARRLRELIEGSRSKGSRIPKEIEELLRMIPKRQGKGPSSPDGRKPESGGTKKGEQAEQLHDARKRLDEDSHAGSEKKPERGDPSKPAERDRSRGGKPEKGAQGETGRNDDVPAWVTALPPEIRDALAGGRAEKIPARYRHLIARYNLWLQKKAGKRGR